jgi:type II secretory pathway pseudopilin PulG
LSAHGLQRGVSGVLVLVIFIIIMVLLLAVSGLSGISTSLDAESQTVVKLASAVAALEQFAATTGRLPCPADPGADTGDEVPAGIATCTFGEGTVPWKTLAMRRDDAFDAWARKISYRVYTGNNGSLTQPQGVSMVECDTVEPSPGGTTAGAGSAGGLCNSSTDPYQRNTTPAQYFAGKGLSLNDSGVVHNDVAFVLISHGVTGLGGYTVSGVRLDMPKADELGNTKETGAFTIRPFSDSDTSASAPTHFDDLLAYRTLPDLVKRAGLSARDWPETATTAALFDNPTVAAAVGHAVLPGDLGVNTLVISGTRVSGFSGSDVATDLTFDTNASVGGIGVNGNGSNEVTNTGGEFIRIDLTQGAAAFGVTLNDFGTYTSGGTLYTEQAEFRFYSSGALLGSPIVESGCRADGGLASFSIIPAAAFDRVEIRALAATSASAATSATGFLLSEINACASSGSTCKTTLWSGSNNCP